ncbi:uncharacterized protein DSM5745_09677 [Aspergillus mulundensis]|uniref:Uncharacterized protein n=1 Tax=Aspergillus mulundensis TaxID=1810919 RepID=A0A3D8QW64_9EURO|nr:hypothetical protein DSM5745_09677 [Aspergillus mulundensis]RDW65938.1 hypothetical protein DSM5745_09677 [Aspergillus mulundensis]
MCSFLELPEDIHLYLCKSLYPRHINNLIQTCRTLQHRLDRELWRLGTATAEDRTITLLDAASRHSLTSVQRLFKLSVDYDLSISDDAVHRALRIAAKGGHEDLVAFLLTKGVDYSHEERYRNHGTSWEMAKEPSALQNAAEQGHLGIVCLLLKHGATVFDKTLALNLAITAKHEDVVSMLLDSTDPDYSDLVRSALEYGSLEAAITCKNEHIFSMLLDCDIDINRPAPQGTLPLLSAVRSGWVWAVKKLLSRGANLELTDEYGNTALHGATGFGETPNRVEIVRLLLESGSDLTCENRDAETPVSYAIEAQHYTLLKLWITEYGLSVDTIKSKEALLCVAAKNNDKDLTARLLQLGVDVNTGQWDLSDTWPALYFAVIENHTEIMELLVSNGAALDSFPGNQLSAVMDIGIMELSGSQATVMYPVSESNLPTPLHVALWKGHVAAAEWLLHKGADLNRVASRIYEVDGSGSSVEVRWTSMHFAAIGGMETLELVMRHGHHEVPWGAGPFASLWVSAIDGQGSTDKCLLSAVYDLCHDSKTGEYLDPVHLKTFELRGWMKVPTLHAAFEIAGLDIGAKDESGKTLLHYAAMSDNLPVIEYLLEHDAPVAQLDIQHRTALYYAAWRGSPKAVRMLLAHGANSKLTVTLPREHQPIWACLSTLVNSPVYSATQVAHAAGQALEILEQLVKDGVDINMACEGRTLLHEVLWGETRHPEPLVRLLLRLGAEPNAVDGHGDTAVQLAEKRGWDQVVDLLLRAAGGLEIEPLDAN